MSVNLSLEVRSAVTPELVRSLSAYLGENEQGISEAVEASVSTVLKMISGLDDEKLPALIKEVRNSGIPGNIQQLFQGEENLVGKGASIIGAMLGNKLGIISSLISSYAIIKPSSASAILSCVAPLVLMQLEKHTRNMTKEELNIWVHSNDSIREIPLPAGISSDLLVPADAVQQPFYMTHPGDLEPLPSGALLLLLLLFTAMLLLYFK